MRSRARPPRRRWCRRTPGRRRESTYEPEGDLVCARRHRGRPLIIDSYDVQYKKSTAVSFTDHSTCGTRYVHHDHRAGRRHVLPSAGAGHEHRAGHWPLVALGRGVDQQGGQQPCPRSELPAVTRNVLENSDPGLVVGSQGERDGRRSRAPADATSSMVRTRTRSTCRRRPGRYGRREAWSTTPRRSPRSM